MQINVKTGQPSEAQSQNRTNEKRTKPSFFQRNKTRLMGSLLALTPAVLSGCGGYDSIHVPSNLKTDPQGNTIRDDSPDNKENIVLSGVDSLLTKTKLGKVESVSLDFDFETKQYSPMMTVTLTNGNKVFLATPKNPEENKRLLEGLKTVGPKPVYLTTDNTSTENMLTNFLSEVGTGAARTTGSVGVYALVLFMLIRAIASKIPSSNVKKDEEDKSSPLDFFLKDKKFEFTDSDFKFKDVRGNKENIKLLKTLVDLLVNKKDNKVKAEIPKGVLFKGPPGTGKTLMAQAVAGELSDGLGRPVKFIKIDGTELVQTFSGMGPKFVRNLFKQARENQPCVIFIDEIDTFGKDRNSYGAGGDGGKVDILNQLLTCMDGFGTNDDILVMAATNRDEVLDSALLRPGRFDYHIDVIPAYTNADRKDVLDLYFKKRLKDKTIKKDIDLDEIASKTVGFSPAKLKSIFDKAALYTLRAKRKQINMDDINEAIKDIQVGMKTGIEPTDAALRQVAIHEIFGHGIAGKAVGKGISSVSVVPRGQSMGHVMYDSDPDVEQLGSRKALLARLIAAVGGYEAEKVLTGDVSMGPKGDLKTIKNIIRRLLDMNMLGNFSTRDYSDQNVDLSKEDEKTFRTVFEAAHATAAKMMEHVPQESVQPSLDRIFEVGSLSGKEADDFIESLLTEDTWQELRKIGEDFIGDPLDKDRSLVGEKDSK